MSITCFHVANYFIWLANNKFSDVSDFSPMKLQKVIFLAQGWHLGLYDEPLFSDDFHAWKYGPVNPSLYYKYKIFGDKKIICDFSRPELFYDLEKFLDKIAFTFFPLKAEVLSGITHKKGSPWKLVRKNLSSKDHSNEIIPKPLIKSYYEELINDIQDNGDDSVVISKFLDFLINDSEINFHKMIPYTEDMLQRDKSLFEGVILCEDCY